MLEILGAADIKVVSSDEARAVSVGRGPGQLVLNGWSLFRDGAGDEKPIINMMYRRIYIT